VRSLLALLFALVCIIGANRAGDVAVGLRPKDVIDAPYAPSPGMAPIICLGYREVAADLAWVKFRGYVGSFEADADGIADLVDAITAFDPHFHRIYEAGARAITFASHGLTQSAFLRALAILDRGMTVFPNDWKLPDLAGDIYTQDLVTSDPAQRRKWDERGTQLIEHAMHEPGAPPIAATWVATMRTKLGQQERAIANLREMILITSDVDAQQRMIAKLAAMLDANKDAIASEMYQLRRDLMRDWKRDRFDVPVDFYIIVGPRSPSTFDLGDLATGGRDLIGAPVEPAEDTSD
jgi:hypothetical protein